MSFNIAICDDDPVFRKEMFEQTRSILQANGINAEIQTFDTVKRLDSSIKIDKNPIELLILDIYLDHANGYDYAKSLQEAGYDIPVILTSVTRDYILEGYDLDAVAYLVKPIEPEKLERVLLKAYRNANKNRLVIQKPTETLSIVVNEILYIEVINKKVYFHRSDGTVQEVTMTLKAIIDMLPENQFIQCHRSYIVSIPSISSINRQFITLSNGEQIPVGRRYYNTVQEKLLDWVAVS